MQDGIITGNGNSRYLKTVSAALGLYPTYEDFMAALIAGTFPIDLNGINTAGWTQQGTPLNKANLFSDSTASALGLSATNTPNDALAKLKSISDNANANANQRAIIRQGHYVGSGTDMVSIQFPKPIKIFLLYRYEARYNDFTVNSFLCLSPTDVSKNNSAVDDGESTMVNSISWSNINRALSFESEKFNASGKNYYYLTLE